MSLKQPVRYPAKYYSHLDAGAPQLADIDGNIKTILKACLVTGIGTKESAGWTSLFEDDYRIVLRRPLGSGNPSDVKVENGVINGIASHRIVSQDNPTGLDDATELMAVNLLARDGTHGTEWHLIATDFGFVFCYAMAENNYSSASSRVLDILYIGSLVGMATSVPGIYVSYHEGTQAKGIHDPWMYGFLNSMTPMRTVGRKLSNKHIITLSNPADDAMQRIFFDAGESLPFYTSLKDLGTTANVVQTLDDRYVLSICNKNTQNYDRRTFYIPLDYWEL